MPADAGDAGSRSSPSTGSRRSSPGDDLAGAPRRRDRADGRTSLPLRDDDVLVVTQKIVSKAEGAIVDLTTVEPRPEAVEFATTWDRDPRQIEVVLREARRVVRMANGVLITETPPRVRLRERRGRRVERRARQRPDRDAAAARPGRVGRRRSARRSKRGSASTSRSSSATRSAGRGAGGSSTSRSGSPGCCRSRTSAASPITTAG